MAATIRRSYELFKACDFPAYLNLLSEDVVYTIIGDPTMIPFAGTYKGKAGVQDFIQRLGNSSQINANKCELLLDDGGENVVASGQCQLASKATGKEAILKWAHIWRVVDGQIVSFTEFMGTAALENAFSS
eukprot:TRINITY_DN19017_c0_g1_i1.p1 TRINITY_DN19017_c0_g1~~TRINITY_DN19017_c0_g1_i1.p1  ORF type:complete len:131 (-),score=17.88 TRINITY_DN19017_c0_g1_i1:458-850(-)